MTRFVRHLRALWPGWTITAPLPFVAHAAWTIAVGRFGWDEAGAVGLALALFAIGPRTQKAFVGLYPVGLVGLFYSAMKGVQNLGLTESSVHVCDVRAREAAWFGITVDGQRETLQDWLQPHAVPALDVLCAVPYATFAFAIFACAAWLYVRDYGRMLRFTWTFLLLNLAGFVTYHVYPVAPPWYYHLHGCRVDLGTHPSAGPNLTRVDAWLGIPVFATMYGKASDVFGAMPSLHAAYAMLLPVQLFDLVPRWARAAAIGFYLLMCFSAVYLDHHWVLDVIAGSAYCVVVSAVVRWATLRLAVSPAQPTLAAGPHEADGAP